MSAVTLSTIRGRVQALGNYESSLRFGTSFLNDQINAALVELYELMSNVHEGYFDIETALATTGSVDNVSLPADFWRLRGVDVQVNGIWIEMRQIGLRERNRYTMNGRPESYRVAAGGTRGILKLYPTPDNVYTLRLIYEPSRTALVADGDTVEDYNGWSDYLVYGALLRCDQREQRPTGEREAELERVRKRIVSAATERRAAEPEYLVNPRGGVPDLWNGGEW